MTTTTYSIEGMTCPSCANHVTKALLSVDGVTAASVDLFQKSALVTFDQQKATFEKLAAAVDDEGYALKTDVVKSVTKLNVD